MTDAEKVLDDETMATWNVWEDAANELCLPKEWRVCAHCGTQSWRFPPHMFGPCPFVKDMAEAAGMKMDAERMHAVRAGLQLEAVTQVIRESLDALGEDDE